MKKLLLGLFSLFFITNLMTAQSGGDALKTAIKVWDRQYPMAADDKKAEMLESARVAIDKACNNIGDIDDKKKTKAWITKGQIYNEIAQDYIKRRIIDEKVKTDFPLAGVEAYKAFKVVANMDAVKKWEKADAEKGLENASRNLSNLGRFQYSDKDFDGAYESFGAIIKIKDIFSASGKKSWLDEEADFNNNIYLTALCALNGGKQIEAKPLLEKLYKMKYEEPYVYEGLYTINSEKDAEGAIGILEEGRKLFPDDLGLLFAEINHYLKLGKMDELVGKLKGAIEKEPDNVSLYSTIGSVYDNLYQRETEAKNTEKAEEYFQNALTYYKQALEKDDKNFQAIYNLGTLYYNKAALKDQERAALEEKGDYSPKGLRTLNAIQAEVLQLFEKALPSFQKAESLNPNDKDTVLALSKIYAQKGTADDLKIVKEFKARLAKINNGEEISAPYFK